MQRESMNYDVVIVGAGPAGLSAACRLKQRNAELSVCVVEKGSEVGAHIISGAVFETRALDELFPDWKDRHAPLKTEVKKDQLLYLRNADSANTIPEWLGPKTMRNHGNYIISLGQLCRWLAEQAEALGVEIFPGFAASEVLYDAQNKVVGIVTGDMGLNKRAEQKPGFEPGMELRATFTLFAEGARGHLGKSLIERYQLAEGKDPQHFGLGLKEIWKVPAAQHQEGLVIHSAGWPLNETGSAGGGFMYHIEDSQVVVGLVVDLSYQHPGLSPYDEFQRYKHHPSIAAYLQGGERRVYGARAIAKGGLQSQPRLSFPGGLLLGDDAGTLNFAKIKGSHTAMKSGMLAADCVADALSADTSEATGGQTLHSYDEAYRRSWAYAELYTQRNFGPAQHRWGNFWGSAYAFFDINVLNGRVPWTLNDPIPDHACLKTSAECSPISYPKPDGKLSFDKLSSVYLSNTNHEEDQPCHLLLKDASVPVRENLPRFDEPAQRYCPAGVYEIVQEADGPRFQINAQNCVHCKTCDIKDPAQNIVWVSPEGGGGPNYPNM